MRSGGPRSWRRAPTWVWAVWVSLISGLAVAAPPAASSVPGAAPREATVKLQDEVVFTLRAGRGHETAAARARAASSALARAVEAAGEDETQVVQRGDAEVVQVGQIPVIEIYAEDAAAAGSPTPEAHAEQVAARVRAAVHAEKQRSAIAGTVFSFSLVVFLGIVALSVLRRVGDLLQTARQWLVDNPERITGLRVQRLELVGPAALRGGGLVAILLGRFIAPLGVGYVWLIFTLSLFQTTRPYTQRLTGMVVTPLSDLAARVAASLPLAVVAAVSGVALYVLVRFVQLFFEGVARRQTVLPWLPPDLAAPTSALLRSGILVCALVFAAPIVTGDPEGALARSGSIALLALGFASTPLLASVLVGIVVVYGRRVRIGQHAEIGGSVGRVVGVGLTDVRLLDREGCETRVPHLLSLVRATRLLGDRPRVVVTLTVAASAAHEDVHQVLLQSATEQGERPVVELSALDADLAEYRVAVSAPRDVTAGDVRIALVRALAGSGIGLGRGRSPERAG